MKLRLVAALLLLAFAAPLAGCIVEEGPGHPGWCARHPYKCP